MASLSELNFNAQDVEPNQPFEAIPAGEYCCVIVGSETKATKDNRGKYLELQLQVARGEFQNRKLFDRLNIWNENEKAVAIAKGTLSAICRAVNVLTPKDSSELHMKPLLVKVAVEPYEGRMRNEVKGYKPIGAGPAPAVPATPAPTTVAPPVAGKPW